MNRRPLLTVTAAAGTVVLVASAGSAGAATAAQPATGRALSSLSLLQLGAAGHELRLADLNMLSDTLDGTLSSIEVIPVTADGTKIGRQVVTPSDGTKSIPAVSSPGALGPVASITSPAFELAATEKPSARAGATSLGSVKLFGLPIELLGTVGADSGVTTSSGAAGQKTVSVQDVALPSIADLLGKLGLDVGALPADTLSDLVGQLGLVTGAVDTAQDAVDQAQAQLDAAAVVLATHTTTLSGADTALTTAQATLTTATTTVEGLLSQAAIADVPSYQALLQPAKDAAELLAPGLADAVQDFLGAQTAAAAAQAAVNAAQTLVNAAQDTVSTLTATLSGLVDTLVGLIEAVLDDTPLVSLGKLAVTTVASVTSAKPGGQTARVVGGEVSGLEVLGTDVLDVVLGSSTVDISDLAGTALAEVNEAIATLNGTLSEVLSNVPSLPALSVPTPVVTLLTKSTSTSVADGFGRASAGVTALSISIPGLTVPSGVQVPGALALPGLSSAGDGNVVSSAVNVSLLALREQAAFRPAVTAAPASTPGGRTHPHTGAPAGVALTALALVGTALVLRRRFLVEH